MKRTMPFFVLMTFLVLAWEFAAWKEFISVSLLPPPHMILQEFKDNNELLFEASLATFTSALLSLCLAAVFAFSLALLLELFEPLRAAVFPLASFFQTVPIIAIAPLLVIYFGFGSTTVVATATFVCFFPILFNSMEGLRSYTQGEKELFQFYRASKMQFLFMLQLPHLISYLFIGLRIAAGLAVVGAVAGEFVAGGGLGALIDSARTQQRVALVFASLICLAFISSLLLTFLLLLNKLQNRFFPTHTKESL